MERDATSEFDLGEITAGGRPVDIYVGERLRLRRIALGMSMEQLSNAADLSFRQLQHYECGTARIMGSRLWTLSEAMGCPVAYFFEGLEKIVPRQARDASAAAGQKADVTAATPIPPQTILLVRAFNDIKSRNVRRSILGLAAQIARADQDPSRTIAPGEKPARYVGEAEETDLCREMDAGDVPPLDIDAPFPPEQFPKIRPNGTGFTPRTGTGE